MREFKICFKCFFHNAVKLKNLKIVKISATILKFPFSVGFFAITLPLVSPGTRVRTDVNQTFKTMEQINKIELRGNVGNVKIQEYGGSESIRFSLATNYAYKGKDGQPVIETTWHNVTAWSGKGMPDFHKIDKGSLVHVVGRLRCQKFENSDGVEKQVYEVLANRLTIIETDENVQPSFGL